jgi:hypothetical protein
MRVIFPTVILLGLLLTGLSIFELRLVIEYRSRVHDVQSWLAALDAKRMHDAEREHAVFTGDSLAYRFGEDVGGIDKIEKGWFAVAYGGGALFIIGVAGILVGSRASSQTSPPNKSLQATAAAPASCD